jgi:hypothetical protein
MKKKKTRCKGCEFGVRVNSLTAYCHIDGLAHLPIHSCRYAVAKRTTRPL